MACTAICCRHSPVQVSDLLGLLTTPQSQLEKKQKQAEAAAKAKSAAEEALKPGQDPADAAVNGDAAHTIEAARARAAEAAAEAKVLLTWQGWSTCALRAGSMPHMLTGAVNARKGTGNAAARVLSQLAAGHGCICPCARSCGPTDIAAGCRLRRRRKLQRLGGASSSALRQSGVAFMPARIATLMQSTGGFHPVWDSSSRARQPLNGPLHATELLHTCTSTLRPRAPLAKQSKPTGKPCMCPGGRTASPRSPVPRML